jgi:hypothetical protein
MDLLLYRLITGLFNDAVLNYIELKEIGGYS